jgi:D-alanyl-D-alanine carboxypeptidase/D-alanyl-D-alanine-endopeptidase (penicillin-binding protein 4)
VAELGAAGLRAIAGDVVLDEGTFADPAPGPEWPEPSQHWTEYCALAGGFSANRGALTAVVQPRAAGQSARVGVEPASHGLDQRLSVATSAGGSISVAIEARASGVVVRGTIPAGVERWSDSMAHPDPVELFGHALAAALAKGGVRLEGRVRRERGVPAGERLAALRSPWLPLLAPINTESANSVADQLFLATGLAVGGAGTRAAARAATSEALERLGVSSAGLVQVDGSGLSRANRVTAAQMTALLEAVLSGPSGSAEAFVQSLALAGETGTLEDRMQDEPARGRVRGKTGFIDGTSALSGVAHALSGRTLVFSILVNYPSLSGLNSTCWKPMQDELCLRLVAAAP